MPTHTVNTTTTTNTQIQVSKLSPPRLSAQIHIGSDLKIRFPIEAIALAGPDLATEIAFSTTLIYNYLNLETLGPYA